MINTIFASLFAMMRALINCLTSVWYAVGDFQPVFVAIFVGIVVFDFVIIPMLVFRRSQR